MRKAKSDNRVTRLSRLLDELTDAAKRLGLEVRRERILREIGYRARGGACRLREKYLVIIDRDQPVAEQVEVLVEALRARDLEQLYLSPEARRILQSDPSGLSSKHVPVLNETCDRGNGSDYSHNK